ncbi:apolipoprotein A-II [Boleophthalmus pectinirostris]|uniref:apolipoprotein A-II n=1 Tax=Boleophthalmus pectinirostris TaxID=150288 RepID=UPI00242F7484|nr:apolipoprotein A-II [Boleophthalmus pectinirostris]
MNAKIVFAVFLALQVSLSLCEVPVPDPDLMATYNDLKSTLFRRIQNAYNKVMQAAEGDENTKAAKEALTQQTQGLEPYMQVVRAVGEEVSPAVDRARSAILGVYSKYLRTHMREPLEVAISRIKAVLDEVLPVEG